MVLCNLPLTFANFEQNYFDTQSCEVFQCLIDNGVNLGGDPSQRQKNGIAFPAYCNPDIIRGLVITEAFFGNQGQALFEITNLGNETVNLGVIEWGEIRPWGPPPFEPIPTRHFMLPDFDLEPGKSFVISSAYDFEPKQFAKGNIESYRERVTKNDMWDLADMLIHVEERNSIPGEDSVYWPGNEMFNDIAGGRSCYFIRQHINETDSVVLDQVGGVFDGDNGLNAAYPFSVAGVAEATENSFLIRKYSVKNGNLDFANSRGVGEDDSEWIVVPKEGEGWRDVFWTVGTHGDFNLDENTLTSSVLSVNWENKTITAPWGVRGLDDFINEFDETPGLAWYYNLSPVAADSVYISARTGDQLTVYACGNDVDIETFDITVLPPTGDDNIVMPKYRTAPNSEYIFGFGLDFQAGEVDWPRATQNAPGIDTITGSYFGLPFATRTDTLLKYLEKPENATWEFVFEGGTQKADLTTGDILKVTSENGGSKDYYIKVQDYIPSHEARLAAITWPDIPEDLKDSDGWNGDTIPNFATDLYNYTINIPYNVIGLPVLVPKPQNPNATIITKIINPVVGNIENKTIEYTVTAEDGYNIRVYTVRIYKLKDPANVQPHLADPFLSEFIFWESWSNAFGEICNPGTEPLDLSNYLIAMDFTPDPNEMISKTNEDNWLDRYEKYVPGYKWVDEATWQVSPGMLVKDNNVNPIVMAGDVFCFGAIFQTQFIKPAWAPDYVWPVPGELDVQFNNIETDNGNFYNPWGEDIGGNGTPVRKWHSANWYMFKILNDSIKLGLKPATDPEDFELIEAFGMQDGTNWVIGGVQSDMITNFMRKPEVTAPNPIMQNSFGTNLDDTEWTWTNMNYWSAQGAGWPFNILNITNYLGKHNFNEITDHQSVIYSNVYKVSKGYSMSETITGVLSGITSAEFLSYIVKANENQTLTIIGMVDNIISGGEVLQVLSADGSNTTQYIIEASSEGLSDDAILTSAIYDITFPADTAIITGFEFGILLQTVVDNITVPEGATMLIFDDNHNLIPFEILNKQGQLVDVTVNAQTYFEVTAEDGQTVVIYQLAPIFPPDEIVTSSSLFYVNNEDSIIGSIEPTTTVGELLANLYVEDGATAIVIDKYGFERTEGTLYEDDRVVIIYNWDAYYALKTANEDPRTFKIYSINMCETLPIAIAKDITIELDESGYASISLDDINDGSSNECGESWLTLSKTEFDCSNIGVNTVTLAINNDAGGIAATQATIIVVDNIPPVVIIEDIVDVNENGICEAITDISESITVTDNCDNLSISNDAPESFSIGTTTVTWTVTDLGRNTVTAIQSVTINNIVPLIIKIEAPSDPVDIINPVQVIAQFDDNNLESATWDWGDGTISEGIIDNYIQGNHLYETPGVYTINLIVTDICGETDMMEHRYVVIYDPEGSFVTGGGIINSPLGASVQYPEATGMASFGFVSKYVKNKVNPDGNTKFKFKAGDLDFKSTEYDWLVVSGSKAKFKGWGTINGEGDYQFMISAIDGDVKEKGDPDIFRIKIWDTEFEEVVYDNEMEVEIDEDPSTTIHEGSIVIHDSKTKSGNLENGINENKISDEIKLSIYPNPFTNELNINMELVEASKVEIELIAIDGRTVTKVKSAMFARGYQNISHSTKQLSPGIYFLTVKLNNSLINTEKLIKTN